MYPIRSLPNKLLRDAGMVNSGSELDGSDLGEQPRKHLCGVIFIRVNKVGRSTVGGAIPWLGPCTVQTEKGKLNGSLHSVLSAVSVT